MTRPKKKICLIFDLDHCLFKTAQFFQIAKKEFKKKRVSEFLFLKSFQESKIPPVGTWHPRLQIEKIISQKPNLNKRELSEIFPLLFSRSKEFLYFDVSPFLKKWQRQNHQLILITHGRRYVQKAKIENSGLNKFFDRIIITPESDKLNALKQVIRKRNFINIYIDDRQNLLISAKQKFPFLITILLQREKKDRKVKRAIDYQIRNLKELDDLIAKFRKERRI